jgi:hypothetical protein
MNGYTEDQPARADVTARIWLFLLKSGGRWIAKDVATEINERQALVAWQLAAMDRYGQARKYPVPGMKRRFTYGVTGACKIPRSINVQDISDCVTAQAEDAEEQAA